MKKIFYLLFFTILIFAASFIITPLSHSDELEDIGKEINDLTNALNMSINATKPLESQLNTLKSQIAGIKQRINSIETDVAIKKKNIDKSYANLEEQQKILDITIRDYYIKNSCSRVFNTSLPNTCR